MQYTHHICIAAEEWQLGVFMGHKHYKSAFLLHNNISVFYVYSMPALFWRA